MWTRWSAQWTPWKLYTSFSAQVWVKPHKKNYQVHNTLLHLSWSEIWPVLCLLRTHHVFPQMETTASTTYTRPVCAFSPILPSTYTCTAQYVGKTELSGTHTWQSIFCLVESMALKRFEVYPEETFCLPIYEKPPWNGNFKYRPVSIQMNKAKSSCMRGTSVIGASSGFSWPGPTRGTA